MYSNIRKHGMTVGIVASLGLVVFGLVRAGIGLDNSVEYMLAGYCGLLACVSVTH